MARDYLSLVKRIEGVYPQSKGTTGGGTGDEPLRALLVRYFNDLAQEIDESKRWSYNYVGAGTGSTVTQLTTANTTVYALPSNLLEVKDIYRIDTAGNRIDLYKYDRAELGRVYGDNSDPASSSSVVAGAPVRWALNNRSVEIFPPPDTAGPDSGGNYLLQFEGYAVTNVVVETTGTTTSSSTTLTVPSTSYLTAAAAVVNGCDVAVRGAGYLGGGSVADDLITTATTVAASGTTSTLALAAVTAVTSGQTFYNARPWICTWAPKAAYFGMLREVACYLRDNDDYQKWEARFQHEVEVLAELELSRTFTRESFATAQPGQRDSQLRRWESFTGVDYRGAV